VRDVVLALREQAFPPLTESGIFRLLVTGGSQGATVLSDVVPDGLALLPEHFRRRLQVTQQCRAEDIEQVRAKYAKLGIPADLATYLPDLPDRLAWSHLVIARAGASTIAELTAAGRPAILIPLPTATDNHQVSNAREMAKAGGARMILQKKFTAVELAKQMQKLGLEPEALARAADAPRRSAGPTPPRIWPTSSSGSGEIPPKKNWSSQSRSRSAPCPRCLCMKGVGTDIGTITSSGSRHRMSVSRRSCTSSAIRCRAPTCPKATSSRACANKAFPSRSAMRRTIWAMRRWW
jgi:UDP-N-acetylglucosamine transferase subunit ALG13